MKKTKLIFKRGTYGTLPYNTKKLTPLKYNRNKTAKQNFADPERVKKHMTDMENDTYIDTGWDVLINEYGIKLDGHSRSEARRLRNESIRYYVTRTPKLNNTNHKKLAAYVSYLNAYNPMWTKLETYEVALSCDYNVATRIEKIINYISSKTGIETNKVAVSWIYSIMTRNAQGFSDSKDLNTLKTFDDKGVYDYSSTPEFLNDIERYISLIKKIKNSDSRYNNISKYILKLHWNQKLFDIDTMLDKIDKYGFASPERSNVDMIKTQIQEVYNSSRGRLSTYFKLYDKIPVHRNSSIIIHSYKPEFKIK